MRGIHLALVPASVPAESSEAMPNGYTEVTGMRAVAIVGWLGIVGAFLVWQGIGLVRGPEWPTMSDFFRAFMAVPLGRFLVFGLWLWLGWHLFLRGWDFFLRG
jgi:Family of unknown function (DUF6186)